MWTMCEFQDSTGNGFGDISCTDKLIYFIDSLLFPIKILIKLCLYFCIRFWFIFSVMYLFHVSYTGYIG